jgi:WD40 repeat protein
LQESYKLLLDRIAAPKPKQDGPRVSSPLAKGFRNNIESRFASTSTSTGTSNDQKREIGNETTETAVLRQGVEDGQQLILSSNLKELGDEAYRKGDFKASIEYYNAAAAYSKIDSLVSYAELLFARGEAYAACGEGERAISDAKRTTELRPIWPDAWALAGRLYLSQEDWLNARQHLEKAVQLLLQRGGDGEKLLAGAREDLRVARKALEDKFCRCVITGHEEDVRQVSFSPSIDCLGKPLEERWLATCSGDGTVKIWNGAGKLGFAASGIGLAGECLFTLGHEAPVSCFEWCPDGSGLLVSASADGKCKIWKITKQAPATGAGTLLLKCIQGHTEGITHVTFDKYGGLFATVSEDGCGCVWDTETGFLMHRLEGHRMRLNKGCFHPTGRSFCTGSDDTTAKVWDLAGDVEEAGKCIHTLEWGDGKVNNVEYSQDGRFILMVTRKSGTVNSFYRLLLFSSITGRICRWYDGHAATITALSPLNPLIVEMGSSDSDGDGDRGATSDDSGGMMTWATSSLDGTLKIWELSAEPTGAGTYLLESDEFQGGVLQHWERPLSRCKEIEKFHQGALYCVSCSPDGRFIGAGGYDKQVRIFDSETLECMQVCSGHSGPINSLAWSDDSSLLVSASNDKTCRVWNITTE